MPAGQSDSRKTNWPAELVLAGSLVALPIAAYAAAVRTGPPAAVACTTVLFLLAVPGLLAMMAFQRLPKFRPTAPIWSLAANTAALMFTCLVLRHTTGIGRTTLAGAWLAWTIVLFLLAWRPNELGTALTDLARRRGPGLIVGVVAVTAGVVALYPEQFVQCFNEDGTETYELAQSLRDHFLPNWELETWDPIPGGRMGTVVVNPSLVNSYWTFAIQTLVGGKELPTRLPYWGWWTCIFLVSCRLASPGRDRWPTAAALALLMLLVAVLFTFYVGWNGYMADVANPGVTDALFTLCILLGFDALRHRDRWAWAIAILLGSLVLYAGPVMTVLFLAAAWWWKPIERRELRRWTALIAALAAATAAFYVVWGWRDGSLAYWIDTLDQEYVQHYLADVPRSVSVPLFFGYFLLGCGGVAAAGLVMAREHAWQRTVATVTLLYLAIVLGAGFKNLHWLAPLWPVPLILFLQPGKRLEIRAVAAIVSIAICLVIAWPRARTTFTLNRELGQQTTLLTADPLTAATWARVRLEAQKDRAISWECDAWTWVAYAELDPRPQRLRPFVVTDGGPPSPEYRLLASRPVEGTATVARLYVGEKAWADWLGSQRPLRPADRYAWVFQPLAAGRFSPHDNGLQDVRRLWWPFGRAADQPSATPRPDHS
jgi:hypothetical protein